MTSRTVKTRLKLPTKRTVKTAVTREYQMMFFDFTQSARSIEHLNEKGRDGWRVVGTFSRDRSMGELLLERELLSDGNRAKEVNE